MATCQVAILLFILSSVLIGSSIRAEPSNDTKGLVPLYLLGLVPMTGDSWPAGKAILTTFDLALEHVNSKSDLLPGYDLRMHWSDTKCEAGPGINALFEQLYQQPNKIMIVGAGCSVACIPTAEASLSWNLTVVSYSCLAPTLSNKNRFPHFFRTATPDIMQNPARVALMSLIGWQNVAIFQESLEYFSSLMDDLIVLMEEANITLITNEIFQKDYTLQLKNLQRKKARIIITGFYEDFAVSIFCEAYHMGLYGDHILWTMPNWYSEHWWQNAKGCTPEELIQVINGSLYFGPVYKNPISETSIAGIDADQFDELLFARSNYTQLYGSNLAPMYYDAIWAAALALNETLDKMEKRGINKSLADFAYKDHDVNSLIIESMYDLEFIGVRGYTKFDANGDPSGIVEILQHQGESMKQVGLFLPRGGDSDEGVFQWVDGGILWRGGRPPKDSVVTIVKLVFVSDALYSTMTSLAVLGIILAVSLLTFNVCFRKTRLIKLSSPNINNLILVGCTLIYTTVIAKERSQHTVTQFCTVRSFTFIAGFDLAFGALFAKTWRVHWIMVKSIKGVKKVTIRDTQLIFAVLALTFVQLLVLVTRYGVAPFSLSIVNTAEEAFGSDEVYQYQVCHCESEYGIYFIITNYTIQGFLLIFGAFLAWETRTVQIKALNDSKLIGMCIYNVVIFAIMGAAISHVLSNEIEFSYGFASSLIVAGTTIVQVIVFFPKVFAVLRGQHQIQPQERFTSNIAGPSTEGNSVVKLAQPTAISSGKRSQNAVTINVQLDPVSKFEH